ncbi:MAG: alanine/glycine:cation symporter family protein, partial [Endozoicomonas sp.]
MAIAYLIAGLMVLGINADKLPEAFEMIFSYAFTPHAAEGGFAGAAVWMAIRFGVARGVFSNEAGLGSAPIAHAASQTKDPVRQGLIAMLGTFIDTIIICSITGLAIITSGLWTSGTSGAALTSAAFAQALPGVGNYVIAIALSVFAFTTILGWALYGERSVEYIFGVKAIAPYRILWILAIPLGAVMSLDFIWLVADTLNAMMALPNLIALFMLSPVVFTLSKDYFDKGEGQPLSAID